MATPEFRAQSKDQQLPSILWLGKEDGRWPVQAFTDEPQAMVWQTADVGTTRRIWQISTTQAVERVAEVVPKEYRWRESS